MNLHVQVNVTNELNCVLNDKGGGLYTSQTAESYLRFPATASPCSDWLLCQAEAVEPKLRPWADVLMHIHVVVGKSVNVKAVSRAD